MRRWLLVVVCAACGAREAPQAPAAQDETFRGSFSPPPARDAEVVAEVNGERIYAADVARVMAARGVTAQAALDELVTDELLAGEARRRGLSAAADVVETRRRERVRALLRRDFEPSFDGPEDVPLAEVEQIYAMPNMRSYYDHERYHGVAFVRAELKKDAPPDAVAAARAAAQAYRDLAVAARPATKDDFFAVAKALPPGLKLMVAPNQTFQTTRHGRSVEEFAKAAFDLQNLGDISPPTRTPWGWDVLYLYEIIPERHTAKDEAFADIRVKRFETARRLAYQRWVEGFMKGVHVTRNDALLESVLVDSLIGM